MKPPKRAPTLGEKTVNNVLWATVAFLAGFAARFATSVYVIRLFDKESLGGWSIIQSFVAWLVVLATLGLHGLMLRETLRRVDRGSYWWLHASAARVAFTILFGLLGAGALAILDATDAIPLDRTDWIVLWIMLAGSLAPAIKAAPVLDAAGVQYVAHYSQAVVSLATLVALVALVRWFGWVSIVAVALAQQFFGAAQIFFTVWHMHRNVSPIRWRFSWRRAAHDSIRSLPKGVEQVFSQSQEVTDKLLLGAMAGKAPAADYLAATSFTSIAVHLDGLLYRVFRPLMLEGAAKGDRDLLIRRTATCSRAFSALAIPLSVGSAFLASSFIPVVYGPRFFPAVWPAFALSFVGIAHYAYRAFNDILFALGADRQMVRSSAVAFAANLALNLALIPFYGAAGAAWATLASYALAALAAARQVRGLVAVEILSTTLRPLAATVPMALAVLAVGEFHYANAPGVAPSHWESAAILLAQVAAGAAAYGAALLPMRQFTRGEWELLLRGPFRPLRWLLPDAFCRRAA